MNETTNTNKGRPTALTLQRLAWHALLDRLDDLESALLDAANLGIELPRGAAVSGLGDLRTAIVDARPRRR